MFGMVGRGTHTQLARLLVHHIHERLLAARNMDAQHAGGIIGRVDHQSFEQMHLVWLVLMRRWFYATRTLLHH